MRGQTPPLVDGKLPVFIFPTSVNFFTDDQSSHKQVLTLYNPYDFLLKFKILSTSPQRYSVVDSEGSIKARCCVDIVIRHKDVCVRNEGMRDKFRVQVSEQGTNAVIGQSLLLITLFPIDHYLIRS
ncbi:hypothetical protein CAPTEDRAFT_140351 [Capitella teleta]|uniref:MSP domain-containing protein n=1 Tax=Capitella teleta TaxID=283909 RepID=R7ULR5_CAPTE|nr:hypothetical protein CAPTEDRAFT_140351 [Capitella teleta]|eukprot:ELU07474.1 hypothetical protein CAPTEDRAFT_140351 [Capitella teleta]